MAKRKRPRKRHIAADLSCAQGRRRAERELLWGDHGFLRLGFSNLHAISNEMWRANQPSPRQIKDHIRDRGIRTVVNLRGSSTKGYYLLEREACAAAGIELLDFQVFSRDMPRPDVILGAQSLFQTITYPALMHCKSGADRAGLMSTLYCMFRLGQPVEEARRQLSLKYLHVRQGKTGLLDAFFQAYLDQTKVAPRAFLDWVQSDYDPETLKAEFLQKRKRQLDLDRLLRRE